VVNIVVCVKQVPDTEARVQIADDGKSVDTRDINFILNPFDEFAVEQAMLAKEQHDGEVTVLSLGDDSASATIRTAMAMGADKGILLKTSQVANDPLQVARAIAREIGGSGVDVVFFGKQAVGNEHGQVGVLVGELLGLPAVSEVSSIEVTESGARGSREIEGGSETFECKLPAVFTTQKGLNEPRYPSLKGRMAAKKKPIEEKEVSLDEPLLSVESLKYPPERDKGRIVGEGAAAAPELVRLLKEEAKVL
jgi:electron transfer flavoprotein beta subunit